MQIMGSMKQHEHCTKTVRGH